MGESMPPPRDPVPLEQLREAVAGGVAARSLRQVARDVGMSPSGLQKFIDGATPYSATRRKLERWFVRESAHYRGTPSPGSIIAAVRVLTQDLPARGRGRAVASILDTLETTYREGGRPVPEWLAEVREVFRGDERS